MNPKHPSILCFYELLVLFASLILETDNSHVDKLSYSQLLVSSLGKRRRSSDGAMHKDSLVSPRTLQKVLSRPLLLARITVKPK